VKGKCPRPLDDGGISNYDHIVVLEAVIVNTLFLIFFGFNTNPSRFIGETKIY